MKPAVVVPVSIAVVLGIVLIMYLNSAYTPKYRWHIDYKKNSEQPYGLLYYYNMVKGQNAGTTLLFNQAYWQLDTNASDNNLIYVGPDFNVDSSQAVLLLDFVKRGNRVLVASDQPPLSLVQPLLPYDSVYPYIEDTCKTALIRFNDDSLMHPLKFNYQVQKDTSVTYSWGGYPKYFFSEPYTPAGFKPVATINDSVITAFVVNHGKGKLIIHSNPITLTNYHMVRRDGFLHASRLSSLLHDGHTYWDDRSEGKTNNSIRTSTNPLRILFSDYRLLWAWYLFLCTVLLYVIFRSKREQRVIPITALNQNDSLAFIKTVGALYFKQGGQKQIAGEMYTLFLSDLRSRYHLSTDMEQKELVPLVIQRSGVNDNVVRELFRAFSYVRKSHTATAQDLTNLYKTLETFNKTRK